MMILSEHAFAFDAVLAHSHERRDTSVHWLSWLMCAEHAQAG